MLRAFSALLLTLAVGACGSEPAGIPAACNAGSFDEQVTGLRAALRQAPGPVRIGDGSVRLSDCVHEAVDDGELQTVGILYSRVATELGRRIAEEPQDALQLGYLVGAARRGAKDTNGIQLELVRRLEQAAGLEDPGPRSRSAYDRGLAAGERDG